MLLEEQGAHLDGQDLLMTPKQKLFQEMGMVPKFASGKRVLSPEDMKAELFIQKTARPKFANGGQATDPYSHPALATSWNNFFK